MIRYHSSERHTAIHIGKTSIHIPAVLTAALLAVLCLAGCPSPVTDTSDEPANPEACLYVANAISETVSTFQLDSETGALEAVGTNFARSYTMRIAIPANRKFLYAVNGYNGCVTAFSISSDGALTPITGLVYTSSFNTGTNPRGIATTPDSNYIYVANATPNTISCFSIDSSTGALSDIGSVDTGTTPNTIVIGKNGDYLYVTNRGANSVSAYSIGSNGSLVPITGTLSTSTYATGVNPGGLDISRTNGYLYAANYSSNSISVFEIDNSDGSLTPTATVETGVYPTEIAITPEETYLYVTNTSDDTVSAYAIDPDSGGLTPVTGTLSTSTYNTGDATNGVAVDRDGNYLYVANQNSGSVSAFSIGENGSLAALSPSSYTTGNTPIGLAVTP